MKFYKPLLAFLFLAWMLGNQCLNAQEVQDTIVYQKETAYNNVVKLDIFSPIAGMLAIAYERTFNDMLSGQLELRTIGSGFILTPELRIYLSKFNAPQGVYLTPWVRVGNGLNELKRNSKFGTGLCVGVQSVKKHIALSAFIGPALYFSSTDKTLTVLRGGLLIGYAF